MKHSEQLCEMITHVAAEYLVRNASTQSLITVTRTILDEEEKKAVIYLSVMPKSQETNALAFAKRERSYFREYFKSKSSQQRIPTFDFEIDTGESNRQRIDELLRK